MCRDSDSSWGRASRAGSSPGTATPARAASASADRLRRRAAETGNADTGEGADSGVGDEAAAGAAVGAFSALGGAAGSDGPVGGCDMAQP